jgi:hypothetical protein
MRWSLSCEIERGSHICLFNILRREFSSKIPSWAEGQIRENGFDVAVPSRKVRKSNSSPCVCISGLLSEAAGYESQCPFFRLAAGRN